MLQFRRIVASAPTPCLLANSSLARLASPATRAPDSGLRHGPWQPFRYLRGALSN